MPTPRPGGMPGPRAGDGHAAAVSGRMIRVLVGLFHTVIAAALASDGLTLLVQAQMNAQWERGFYGEMSPGTLLMLCVSLLALLVGAFQGVIGVGFAVGQRWSVHGLVALSLVLMLFTPFPWNALMALAAVAGVLELLPEPAPAEED